MWQVEVKIGHPHFLQPFFGSSRWEGRSWVSHVLHVYSCMCPASWNDNPQNIGKISSKLYPAKLHIHISIWSCPLLRNIEMGNFLQDIEHCNLDSPRSHKMRKIAPWRSIGNIRMARHSFIPNPMTLSSSHKKKDCIVLIIHSLEDLPEINAAKAALLSQNTTTSFPASACENTFKPM